MSCKFCGGDIPVVSSVWLKNARLTQFCSVKCRNTHQRKWSLSEAKRRYGALKEAGASSPEAVYGRASYKRYREVLAKLRALET